MAISGRTGVVAILGDPDMRPEARLEQIEQLLDFMIGPCDASSAR
jgi:hypothetical protein